MFVDTSAIIAIVMGETGAQTLMTRLGKANFRLTSPMVVLEASMVLSSHWSIEPSVAESHVRSFIERAGIAIAEIDDATASLAIDAFNRFGKGRGSKARLNLSDCLSYACAKQHRVPLLYVGADFAATDLA